MTNEEHIEQLKKLRSFHNGSYGRSINKAIQALEQEPKTGHWIDHHLPEAGKCMQYMSECSVCGKMICNRYNIYKNFCPCCGAKMIEPQERSGKE